jgi:hypothetical protein
MLGITNFIKLFFGARFHMGFPCLRTKPVCFISRAYFLITHKYWFAMLAKLLMTHQASQCYYLFINIYKTMLMNYSNRGLILKKWYGKTATAVPLKSLLFTLSLFLLTTSSSWANWSFKEILNKHFVFSSVTLPTTSEVCQGGTTTLGPITISEDAGENGDFDTGGSSKTLVLEFGAGITFPLTNTVDIKLDGGTSTDVTITTDGTSKLTISYKFGPPTTAAENNSITISNLQVDVASGVAANNYELKVNESESTSVGTELDLDFTNAVFANLTVKEKPAAPTEIYGPASLFKGETAVYSVPIVAGVDSYEWTIPTAHFTVVSSSLNESFVVVTANSAVSTANISVIAKKNNCSSAAYNQQVSINTKGLSVSNETTTLCDNQQVINLPDIVLTEKFYADFDANTTGTLQLEFNDNTKFDFEAVTSKAIFTTASGQQEFDVTRVNKNTLRVDYNFSGSQAEINSLIIRGIQVKAQVTSGSGYIKMKTANTHFTGITPTTELASLTIGTSPVATGISFDTPPTSICTNTDVTFNITDGTNTNVTYEWQLPAGMSIKNTTANSVTVTLSSNAVSGNIEVRAVNNSGCKSPWAAHAVTVSATPEKSSIVTGSDDICLGSTSLYYVSTIPGAISYEWVVPTGKLSSADGSTAVGSTEDVITTTTNFINLTSIDISATPLPVKVRGVSAGCGAGDYSDIKNITITSAPAVNIVGVTEGQTFTNKDAAITLSARLASNNSVISGGTFSGVGVSGNKFSPSAVTVSGTAITVPITYTYTVAGESCPSVARVNVIVSTSSGIDGISGVYCEGAPDVITFQVARLRNDIISTKFSSRYIVGLQSLPGLTGPSPILNSLPGCSVSAPIPSSTAKYTYTFAPGSLAPGKYEIQAYVVTVFSDDIILKDDFSKDGTTSITSLGTRCSVSPLPLATVVIEPKPTPTIRSTAGVSVCADGTTEHTYSVATQVGHSYAWEVSSGGAFVSSSSGDVVKVVWSQSGNQQVKVISTNDDTKCSGADSTAVVVNAVPTPGIIGRVDGKDKNAACAYSTVTYTGVNTGGVTGSYAWSVTNGSVISGQGSNTVEVAWLNQPGTLTLSTTNANGCTGSVDLPVTINTASDPNLQGPDAVCANAQGIEYTIDTPNPTDVVVWTVSGDVGHTISPDNAKITVDWGAGPIGTISVQKTSNGCVGTEELNVAINALPVAEVTKVASIYCATQPTATFQPTVNGNTDVSMGTGVYSLEKPDGTPVPSATFSGNDLNIAALVGSAGIGTYVVKYTFTVSAGGCQDVSSGQTFEIIAKPDATFTGINPTGYCASDNLSLDPSLDGGFFTVTELNGGSPVIGTSKDFPVDITNVNTNIPIDSLLGTRLGEYQVIYTFRNSSGCEDISDPSNFSIYPLPDVTMNNTNIQPKYCVRRTAPVSMRANVVGQRVVSYVGPGGYFFEVRRVSGNRAATEFKTMTEPDGSGGTQLSNNFNAQNPIPTETPIANNASTTAWNELAGVYEIRYTYTNFITGCRAVSDTISITLDKLPVVSFTGLKSFYCKAVTSAKLVPSVDGVLSDASKGTGTFRIYNASDIEQISFTGDEFNPSLLGLGTFKITYEYKVNGGCQEVTAPRSFTIGQAPTPTFSFVNPPTDNKYCVNGDTIKLSVPSAYDKGVFKVIASDGQETTLDSNTHYILINSLSGEGSYDVEYSFGDAFGCSGTSIRQEFKLVPLPLITILGITNQEYCVKSTPIALTPQITVENKPLGDIPDLDEANAYFEVKRISGVQGSTNYVAMRVQADVDNKTPLTYVFNPRRPLPNSPAIADNAPTNEWNKVVGEYAIRYVFQDENGCRNTSAEQIIKITPLPELSFTGLDASYCDDVELVTLTPFDGESKISSGVKFKYRKIDETTEHEFPQGFSFIPKDLDPGVYEIILVSTAAGCSNSSNRDGKVTVTIEPTPKNIKIVASRDYNSRVVNFSATANNVNASWNWSWDFKDGTTSKEQNPIKQLNSVDPQVINYEVIPSTELGCNAMVSKRFKIDFDFTGHCEGGVTQFTNLSELPGDVIGSVSWDFGDGQGTSTELNPGHTYQTPGTYWVTLSVNSQDGVATYKLRRRLDIFPVVTVNTEQFYVEGFENGTAGWISHGVVDVDRVGVDSTSWTLKNPNGFVITNPDGNAWITDNRSNPNRSNTDANYNSNEQSYVESPCFDIAGLNKPMISFSYWSDTDLGGDGVSLLYTIDDGKTWYRLGTENLGINWYNTKPILGAPGSGSSTVDVNSNPDSQGWSGKIEPTNGTWKIARYSLTEILIKMEQMGITNRMVRFRMSFGSNADNTPNAQFDGFAFDNVIISNRNRLVLLEYFINTGVANAAKYDLEAKNFPQTGNKNEIVKIHHHTAFPAVDPLNEANPKDPSARAFHHGIREVPRGIIDGYFRDELIGQWTQDIFADRTLIPSPFKIDVTNATTSGGQLNISTQIKALLAFDRKVVINVVVVDSAVTVGDSVSFYNVTRKMLPDAAGTYREAPWTLGESQTLDLSWDYGNLDPSGFKIVVFIEDYETKEIWQAGTGSVSVQRKQEGQSQQQVTSVEDELLMEGAVVYPNPTTNRLNVAIKAPLSPKAQWQIWSVTGRLVKQGRWTQGKRRIAIDVQDLAGGLYILRVADKGKTSHLRFEKH